jgi:DUF1680 family protein
MQNRQFFLASLLMLLFAASFGIGDVVAQCGETTPPKLTPVPIQQVTIDDEFWSPKYKVWREVTINDIFDKLEKIGVVRNFDYVRDGQKGKHEGQNYFDSWLYETIRGVSDFLAAKADPTLEKRIDEYIKHIAAAQAKDPDGYLNTGTSQNEPNHRWGRNGGNEVKQHDVYNAGALVEAGVHYYLATGKTELLQAAAKLTNYMCDEMGPPPKKNIIPGHALPEEAVTNLYLLFRNHPELKQKMPFPVDETRYLKLAEFWIEARGHHEGRQSFEEFEGVYNQDKIPVLQQTTIDGHAVRATLMCAGLSALAAVNDRDDYRQAAERLWSNLTNRRMYITGGAGATAQFEAFAPDYVLPNDGYLESCAAIGSAFFSHNMNLLCADARYADVVERVLYNGALSTVSLKGDHYYYQNPLEVKNQTERWAWHACPCCPPMFLKFMGAMPGYIYATGKNQLYVNLYVGSSATVDLDGTKVAIRQQTRYPWEGKVKFSLKCDKPTTFDLCLRAPAWCQGKYSPDDLYRTMGRPAAGAITVTVNGKTVEKPNRIRGYICLPGVWKTDDVVELTMDMPVRRVVSHPAVAANVNRVAIMRGPVVYCLESVGNTEVLDNLYLDNNVVLSEKYHPELLGGVTTIQGTGVAVFQDAPKTRPVSLTWTPFYANANRGPTRMLVWIPRRP